MESNSNKNAFNFKPMIIDPSISWAVIGPSILAIIYISGYLISSLYLRAQGVPPLPLLQAEYIEIGIVFITLTALIILSPILVLKLGKLSYQLQNKALPKKSLTLYAIATTNYLAVLSFLAFFVTGFEWQTKTSIFGLPLDFGTILPFYLVAVFVLMITPLFLRRGKVSFKSLEFPSLDFSIDRAESNRVIHVVEIICQCITGIFTVITDYVVLTSIKWLPKLLWESYQYILSLLFLLASVLITIAIVKGYKEWYQRSMGGLIGGAAVLLSIYFCAFGYSLQVFRNIPSSRGGAYPTHIADIILNDAQITTANLPRRGYILQESEHMIYYQSFDDISDWFNDDPPTYVISRNEVSAVTLYLIKDGRPRTINLMGP